MAEQENQTQVPEKSFEEALGRLEQIVNQLEQGQLSLEESMACFEEGMQLSKLCGEKLQVAQNKIEMLTKQANGSMCWTAVQPVTETTEH